MIDESERKETRRLLVPLTSEEFLDRARHHAGIDDELDKLDAERKSVLEDFKNRKGAILARKTQLSQAVRTSREEREVDCEWQENWKQKCWQLIRLDTKEVVDTIAMTAEDLQLDNRVDGKGQSKPPSGKKGGGKKKGKDAAAGEKEDGKKDEEKKDAPAASQKKPRRRKGKE